jgi:hypothetical protein
MSSSSSTFGYSFFFGAYFLGYYFFFYWAAGFEPAAGAEPPIFEIPLAINLFTSFPFKVSISLVRSVSAMVQLEAPRTFLRSAAAGMMRKSYRCLFFRRGRGERKQPSTSWCKIN